MKFKKLKGEIHVKEIIDGLIGELLKQLSDRENEHLSVPVGTAPLQCLDQLQNIKDRRDDLMRVMDRKSEDYATMMQQEFAPQLKELAREHRAEWVKIETALDLDHDEHYHIKNGKTQVFKKVKPDTSKKRF